MKRLVAFASVWYALGLRVRVVHADDCSPFDFLPDTVNAAAFTAFVANFKPIFTQRNLTVQERLNLLKDSLSFVDNHNSQNVASNYTLAVNELSAYSEFELKERNGFRYVQSELPNFSVGFLNRHLQTLPASVDWDLAGAVTSAKNQQQCGCCWAMAAAGALEGAAAIDTNFTYLQSLSVQQFISCDTGNYGCDGGSTSSALEYAMNNDFGGLTSYGQYPFEDSSGMTTTDCKVQGHTLAVVESRTPTIVVDTNMGESFSSRVTMMKQALAFQGPVAVAINANCREFQLYNSGIMSSGSCSCSTESCLDHAVLLVGYNDTNVPAYWKIKNSWGPCWGENGFVRLSQEQDGPWGQAGVLAQGVVPLAAYNATPQVSSARLRQSAFVVSSVATATCVLAAAFTM